MKLPVHHKVEVDGELWDFDRHVLDARRIKDRIVVVFDYMSFPRGEQAKNLQAFSLKRELLWTAEHPSKERTDTYVSITTEEPLVVSNFASLQCEIDVESGKLKRSVFTK